MNDIRHQSSQDLALERSMRDMAARIAERVRTDLRLHPRRPLPFRPSPPPNVLSPPRPLPIHPSQQRFNRDLQSLSEFLDFLNPKPCIMETGRPCDQCDICNTQGF